MYCNDANLRIVTKPLYRTTPPYSILNICCYLDQVLVAAGGKWGGVGLWDAEDVGGQQNGVHLYVPHR
jgi:hypothetical protein